MCHFHASFVATLIVMSAFALAGSVVCVKSASASIAATGKNDPREVVADEFAGQAVTFFVGPFLAAGPAWVIALLGLVLFRIFDISKPWPIRKLEKFPAGWGILADDLLAGVYAGAALFLCSKAGVIEYIGGLLVPSGGSPLGVPQAVALGIVQGLTEFLPVSSDGHLVLFENLFNLDPESPQMLLFDLTVHVGTVVAIFVVFRKSIAALAANLLAWRKYGASPLEIYRRSPSVHVLVLAVLVTAVTGVCGLSLEEYFVAARGKLVVVPIMWIINGTLLLMTDWRKKARLGLREFGVLAAIIVGLAQATAILPGISRSGTTICAAILIGLRRRWAVEFSFLIAIPAILGATLLESVKHFTEISSGSLPIASAAAGAVAAALTGVLALKLLIKTSRAAKLKYFAFYCYLVACLVFVYALR